MSAEPPAHESTSVSNSPRRGGPLSGPGGVILVLVLFGAAGALFYKNYRHAAAENPVDSMRRYMCTEDANVFVAMLKLGESPPVVCPQCKKKTGFPCEACYWTKDGGVKDTPTWVILNRHLNKEGDTICPDCGRVVVGHNPDPRKANPPDVMRNPGGREGAAGGIASTQPADDDAAPDDAAPADADKGASAPTDRDR